jgi:hypothetical protein
MLPGGLDSRKTVVYRSLERGHRVLCGVGQQWVHAYDQQQLREQRVERLKDVEAANGW